MMYYWECCMFLLVLSYCEVLVRSDFTTAGYGGEYVEHGTTEEDFTTTITTEQDYPSDGTKENVGNLSLILKMATECETPNNDVGYCIGIKQCNKLLKQLNNSNAKEFLRASMCGPDNEDIHNPKVCCGKYDNFRNASKNNVGDDDIFPKKCGNQKMFMRGRIIGGIEAALGEFPWMARLVHKNKHGYKSFGCSGFLIHTKYVVTAAHCIHSDFTKIRGPVFSVVLGDHNSETKKDCVPNGNLCADPLQISRAAKVIVHPKYDPQSNAHYNDIALVHLNKGARVTEYVKPICLLTDPMVIPNRYYLSGWGKTETEQISKIKMKVELPSFDKWECRDKYSFMNIELLESQICAGGEDSKDSCTGDSGGPLMMTNGTVWFASGIVSYGIGCGIDGWPGVYTYIPSFIPWIKQQIKENSWVGVKGPSRRKNRRRTKSKKIVVS